MFTSTLTLADGTTMSVHRSIVVGRAPSTAPAVVAGSADPLAIEDDSQLSRHHLQLTVDEVGVSATDLGSGNGTVIERDGTRHDLAAMEPMELRSGDVVVFGRQRAILGLDAEFDATVLVGAGVVADDPTPPPNPAPAPDSPSAVAPSPATTVLPPSPSPPPAQPAPPPAAQPPPPGGFVPGRAAPAPGAPGFVPGRAEPAQAPAAAHGYQISTAPASFGARLWGTILDSVVYGFIFVAVIVAAVVAANINPALSALIAIVGYFGIVFLYWRQVAVTGQSWGRRLAGVRVVDAHTGRPIGYWKAFLRFFVAGISGSIFYLGYLWMLWDDKQQTWHDKAAGTVVVRV